MSSIVPPQEAHITYQLQYRACGKASCKACRAGRQHGPYWYAFWREARRLRSAYIGKVAPPPCRCPKCIARLDQYQHGVRRTCTPMTSEPTRRQPLWIFTPSDLVESATGPLIDPTSPTERSRQAFLAQLVPVPLSQIAQLLPARAGYRQVLDLASGTGDWALEVARRFSRCQITGIERCGALVEQARVRAAAAFLSNVSFQQVEVLEPGWPFPDGHFDLVNAQFLARRLPGQPAWRPLLGECVRVLKPGGVIRLVECIEGEATSRAVHTLCLAYQQALIQAGLRAALPFVSEPQRMVWLDGLLADVGCDVMEREVTRMSWTAQDGQGTRIAGYVLLTLRLLQPFLLAQGVISASEFEQAYQQLGEEITRGEFAGSWRIQTSTGVVPQEKPAALPRRRVIAWKGMTRTEMPRRGESSTAEGAAP